MSSDAPFIVQALDTGRFVSFDDDLLADTTDPGQAKVFRGRAWRTLWGRDDLRRSYRLRTPCPEPEPVRRLRDALGDGPRLPFRNAYMARRDGGEVRIEFLVGGTPMATYRVHDGTYNPPIWWPSDMRGRVLEFLKWFTTEWTGEDIVAAPIFVPGQN